MRLILITAICLCMLSMAHAQTDTSYHLLWYAGKKIRTNVLLTSQKDTVTYNPSRGTIKVTSKSANGQRMDNMLLELNKTSKRAQEMLNRLSSRVPKQALPAIGNAIRIAYANVDLDYRKALSNTITLPNMPLQIKPTAVGKGGYGSDESYGDIWDDAIKEMQDYQANHADDNSYTLPEPPRFNFSYCYTCDTNSMNSYRKSIDNFIAAVRGKADNDMVQFAFGVSRQAEFLLGDQRAREVQMECGKLVEFIIMRLRKKVSILINRYIDDSERSVAVLQIALTLDRQMQLLSIGELIEENYFSRAFESLAKRMRKAFQEEDYSIGLNLQLALSTDRQMQLIPSGFYEDIVNPALKFAQFKVDMNISAKTGSDEGFLLAQLRGENWFLVTPDTNCHLKWTLVGPNMNKLKMTLESADMRGKGGQIPYVGTKNWEAPVPTMKLDFCSYETDSVIAYPFNAEEFTELWKMPEPMGVADLKQISGLFLSCFTDPEKLKQEAEEFKNSDKAKQMQKEMAKKYQAYMKFYQNGSLNMKEKGVDMPTIQLMARSQHLAKELNEMIYSVSPGKFVFTPQVHNMERVIVQDRLDGKVLFPDNTATDYAFFHLKIEHDPEGPYVITL